MLADVLSCTVPTLKTICETRGSHVSCSFYFMQAWRPGVTAITQVVQPQLEPSQESAGTWTRSSPGGGAGCDIWRFRDLPGP